MAAPCLPLTTCLSLSLLLLAQTDFRGLLIAVEDRIESISSKGNSTNTLPGAKNVLALTSPVLTTKEDHKLAFMFATELGSRGPSVYRIEGEGLGHTILQSPQDINSTSLLYFESAAFDEEGDRLFLTSKQDRTVFSLDNKPDSKLEKFYSDKEKYPTGVAIDVCTRSLYWINSNRRSPSIEISLLDSRETWSLIDSNMTKPKAITFDSHERKLYWAAVNGRNFALSRANPDGSERDEFCHLLDHDAFALAVDRDYVYWSEWSSYSVWRAGKNTAGACKPELVRSFPSSRPHGLAVIRDDKLNCDGAQVTPKPPTGDISHTEGTTTTARPLNDRDPRCDGLCLHGECEERIGQAPGCQCEEEWRGERCEVNLCHNFCLHQGQCYVIEDQPECLCLHGYTGDRCHLPAVHHVDHEDQDNDVHGDHENDQLCEHKTDIPLYFLSAVTAVLTLTVIVLSIVVHNLRLRPRVVRKRFISVAKEDKARPKGRQNCGLPVDDGLQLDIENCCNMTLCETPCFEPPTRGPKKGRKSKRHRDDKASLLANCDEDNE